MGHDDECVVAGPLVMGSGRAQTQRGNMGPPSRGLATCRRGKGGQVHFLYVHVLVPEGRKLGGPIPVCRS